MPDLPKEGYTEVTASVKRTVQIHEYEPLSVSGTFRKVVKDEDAYKEFGDMCVQLEVEIMEFLGIKD